jgi:hypothetical protein
VTKRKSNCRSHFVMYHLNPCRPGVHRSRNSTLAILLTVTSTKTLLYQKSSRKGRKTTRADRESARRSAHLSTSKPTAFRVARHLHGSIRDRLTFRFLADFDRRTTGSANLAEQAPHDHRKQRHHLSLAKQSPDSIRWQGSHAGGADLRRRYLTMHVPWYGPTTKAL